MRYFRTLKFIQIVPVAIIAFSLLEYLTKSFREIFASNQMGSIGMLARSVKFENGLQISHEVRK